MKPSTTVMPKLNGMPVFRMKYAIVIHSNCVTGHRPQAGLLLDPPAHFVDAHAPFAASASTNDSTFRSGGTNSSACE